MAHFPALDVSLETLTQSDFLGDSKSQLDSDHYGLEKVKRRSMVYFTIVQLRALITQEAEVKQAKAQEVTFKKGINEPPANVSEADIQKENVCWAHIKMGKFPAPL